MFTTQAAAGSTQPFSFAVLGDWGLVDANGNNPDQQNLLGTLAASGVRFAVTTGDNGYPSGSQTNYGDLKQVGAAMGAIFGARFWPVPGASVPLFTAAGNHGLSGTAHADLTNWPQDLAVSSSGGRYANDLYCCVNGTTSTNYASAWYAFDAGPARFYVLTSAWGDTNPGTASVYANDYAAHFAPGTPEYTWLVADLQSHPSGLKFAFSHYPFYSDDKSQGSDTFIEGSGSLEGLLAQYGVNIAFNGHSHVYERNLASAPGYPFTYITGGGGATLEPIGPCHAFDAYGLGWSPTKLTGTKCGSAPVPTSATQVFHFIKVTVSGTTVTVAPTDELGRTFDVQTYSFANTIADTVIDSGPASPSTSSTATFSFHSTITPATFTCARRRGADAVHEPGHVHGPRRRQPFVRGRCDRRLGHGPDARRAHLDGRRDRADGARLGGRHAARPERRRRDLGRLERRRRPGRLRHLPRRRRHRHGGPDPDELLRRHRGAGDDLSVRRPRARRRRQRLGLLHARRRDDAGHGRPVPERLRGRPHRLDVLGRPRGAVGHGPQRRLRGRGQHDERRHLREEDRHGRARRLRTRLLQPQERGEPGQPAAHARAPAASRSATRSSRRPDNSAGATTSPRRRR